MIELKVCVGTSCHLKGAYNVLSTFLTLMEKESLQDKVIVQATFCMGNCGQGVCVSLNGEKYSVDPNGARGFFEKTVKPLIA